MAEGLKKVGEGAVFKRVRKEAEGMPEEMLSSESSQSVSASRDMKLPPQVSRAEARARLEEINNITRTKSAGMTSGRQQHRPSQS